MAKPLTVERFIAAFRLDTGWECREGTRIANDLTAFALERLGSTRDIVELLVIFKMSHDLSWGEIHNVRAIEALP
jgi:hypothetical protein